ncbi:serine hydrolase [Enterococcus pseudoavium]|nr:serine hydrolase [Enterococcus pseudoavium]
MGKHSGVKKVKRANYFLMGLLFLFLAGGVYFAATALLNNQPEEPSKVVVKSSQSQASKENPVTSQATTTSSLSTTQQTSQTKTVQLDTAALTANAEQVYYGVYYFKSGQEFSSHNSAPTVSASVIKVFIMEYAFSQGNLNQQVQGKTIHDWVIPMIQQSDNEATNVLIEYFGMAPLNQFFQAQGYLDTHLERKMLDTVARSSGKENYTSLNDCMAFLKKLYLKQENYPQSAMLDIMKGQTIRTKIPSKLPSEIVVANKTGELDNAENDIGLVLTEENPFAIVVLTKNFTTVEKIQSAIGDFALSATKMN